MSDTPERLRQELRARAEKHRRARARNNRSQAQRITIDNSLWLDPVVRQHGWPGAALVGADAVVDAVYLATQASPHHRRDWLVPMHRAARAGDIEWRYVAEIADLIAVDHGYRQRFGTHFLAGPDGRERLWPLEYGPYTNTYRRDMGLPPLPEDVLADAHPVLDPTLLRLRWQ